jgi:hypothetical protein
MTRLPAIWPALSWIYAIPSRPSLNACAFVASRSISFFTFWLCSISVSPRRRRARVLLSDWGKPSFDLDKWGFRSNPEDLIRDLALDHGHAPHGKISSANKRLHRTIWLWAPSGWSSAGGTRLESEDAVVEGTGDDVVSNGGRRVFFLACGVFLFLFLFPFFFSRWLICGLGSL